MYSCHYCEFQETRFDSIVLHLVNLHPFRKISVDHSTLCEVSGKFLTTNYSWSFNPSDVTSHYKILANDEERNITLEPLCTEADDNSEIQENNTSPTQLEPHDHHTPTKMTHIKGRSTPRLNRRWPLKKTKYSLSTDKWRISIKIAWNVRWANNLCMSTAILAVFWIQSSQNAFHFQKYLVYY